MFAPRVLMEGTGVMGSKWREMKSVTPKSEDDDDGDSNIIVKY